MQTTYCLTWDNTSVIFNTLMINCTFFVYVSLHVFLFSAYIMFEVQIYTCNKVIPLTKHFSFHLSPISCPSHSTCCFLSTFCQQCVKSLNRLVLMSPSWHSRGPFITEAQMPGWDVPVEALVKCVCKLFVQRGGLYQISSVGFAGSAESSHKCWGSLWTQIISHTKPFSHTHLDLLESTQCIVDSFLHI